MSFAFVLIVVIVGFLISFLLGTLFGITDCKKRFAIPRSATGLDEFGKYTFD